MSHSGFSPFSAASATISSTSQRQDKYLPRYGSAADWVASQTQKPPARSGESLRSIHISADVRVLARACIRTSGTHERIQAFVPQSSSSDMYLMRSAVSQHEWWGHRLCLPGWNAKALTPWSRYSRSMNSANRLIADLPVPYALRPCSRSMAPVDLCMNCQPCNAGQGSSRTMCRGS
jgi:hypothetical protein